MYIGPKSRTDRPRKTKIGTEVAHVTRDMDHFQGKKVNLQGVGILWWPPTQFVLITLKKYQLKVHTAQK